tara:strand:- start:495 stop:1364 length:870 start_codon:yes stop_codon:yes gene_type:complete
LDICGEYSAVLDPQTLEHREVQSNNAVRNAQRETSVLPVCVACMNFTRGQFADFRKIVDDKANLNFEILNVGAGHAIAKKHYEILVVNCFDTKDRSELSSRAASVEAKVTSAVNLAIVSALKDFRPDIYLSGFLDYLIFPFDEHEVIYRLHAAASLRECSVRDYRHSSDEMVERACAYMETRLDQPISICELSSAVGTNRNTLNSKFNKEFGLAPIGWHRERRLQRAADLIQNTNDPISKISGEVGFTDSNNFSTAFRKTHGVPPRHYRKMKHAQNLMTKSKDRQNYSG